MQDGFFELCIHQSIWTKHLVNGVEQVVEHLHLSASIPLDEKNEVFEIDGQCH